MFKLKCYLFFLNRLQRSADVAVTFRQTIIYFVYKLSLNYRSSKQSPATHRVYLSAGRRVSAHSAQRPERPTNCPEFITN